MTWDENSIRNHWQLGCLFHNFPHFCPGYHQMIYQTSVLLVICEGNPSVFVGYPTKCQLCGLPSLVMTSTYIAWFFNVLLCFTNEWPVYFITDCPSFLTKPLSNRPISQIPECTCSISHNSPFRTEMCTFLFWMEYCGIWDRCILGFVNWFSCGDWWLMKHRDVYVKDISQGWKHFMTFRSIDP